ncbi:unnamed protein product [Rodentolepis nana]|uniref:CTNNB1 binding N-teminal domain-containing protein n=1 Tax=Rodentolepis nana TaxID=102285 RepID=A0A0R3U0V5_RODNA|nr:unnamed protein product [Rodentolepis nana]
MNKGKIDNEEPSNENGEIAIVTSAAASMEENETPDVNERTPIDVDPVQNNDMAEANE